jgi:16S rRNA (guanine527-N7)-methyltransferase
MNGRDGGGNRGGGSGGGGGGKGGQGNRGGTGGWKPFRGGRPEGGPGRPFQGKGKPQHTGPAPSKPALGQLMARYGVPLKPDVLDRLWAYHQLLRKHNHDQDLTRLIGFDTIAQRHYADCMILHGMMGGKWPSPLVDVGSGAGFPGIMIKLMSPKTRLVLAEPRPRRVQFLEMVIRELGLKDISVFPHKVTSRSFTEPAAGVITRAFETVEKTLPRLGGCLPVGGQAIFMKGPKVAEEMETWHSEEYRILRNQAYRIPNTTQDRVLLILERIKKPAAAQAPAEDEEDDFAEPGDGEGSPEP